MKKVRKITLLILLAGWLIVCASVLFWIKRMYTMVYVMMAVGVVVMVAGSIWDMIKYRCPNCGRYLNKSRGEYCPHCGSNIEK